MNTSRFNKGDVIMLTGSEWFEPWRSIRLEVLEHIPSKKRLMVKLLDDVPGTLYLEGSTNSVENYTDGRIGYDITTLRTFQHKAHLPEWF